VLQYSPKITTDGLVMCLDASQNKSYPTDLPVKNGLVMWMDAADDTTFSYSSGTTVSQWRDKSGFNYHMVPVSAGPTRNAFLNSRKVIACTTSQQIWNSAINLVTSTYTIFGVTRLTGTTNSRVLNTQYVPSTGGNWLLGHWAGYVNQYYAEGWVSGPYGTAANTDWNIFMGDWSGSSTDLANLYTNGTAIATNSNGASAGPIGLGINVHYETSTCEAAEIIVFNRVLSATERKQVHTYLGQKWGISNTDRSIVDLSGNDNHGLLGNGTTADMPLFDVYNKGALKLDGSTDYVAVGNATSLNPTTVTVSIWIKRHGYQSSVASYLRRNFNDAYAIIGDIASDNVRLRIYNGSTYPESPNATLSLNEWTNIVGTYDLANIKIYRNGVFVGQTAHTSAISYSSSNTTLTIGRDDPFAGRYMNANYGSVLIYSRALSATEISQNYEAQKSKFANTIVQQGLVLNLDAGNIYSYGGAGTTFYDVSPTALSWTINNATYNPSDTKYFSYNGSSSWLESSTSAAYDSQTITMECWFYPTTLAQDGFLFEKGQVNTQYSMFLYSGNVFYFRTISTSTENLTFTPSAYLTANAWNHIICTYGAGTKTIYVNGVQIAQQTGLTGTLPTGQTNQYIGKYGNAGNNYPFNGRIGESRVYNIALSAAQVLQNYNATKGRFGL
jgi:hypothetical protein